MLEVIVLGVHLVEVVGSYHSCVIIVAGVWWSDISVVVVLY